MQIYTISLSADAEKTRLTRSIKANFKFKSRGRAAGQARAGTRLVQQTTGARVDAIHAGAQRCVTAYRHRRERGGGHMTPSEGARDPSGNRPGHPSVVGRAVSVGTRRCRPRIVPATKHTS